MHFFSFWPIFAVTRFVWLLPVALIIAAYWQIFTKAGKPGWAVLIPIYNVLVFLQILNRPWWWIFFLLIPFVNLVFVVILYFDLSKAFGRSLWYAVGLVFLSIVFVPILGFGSSVYSKPVR